MLQSSSFEQISTIVPLEPVSSFLSSLTPSKSDPVSPFPSMTMPLVGSELTAVGTSEGEKLGKLLGGVLGESLGDALGGGLGE